MDPVQQFKTLSRYYGDPIYAGESEFISRVMQQFDGLSLKELTRLVDSNREKLALPWELRREWRLRKLSPDLKEKHYAEYAAKRMEDGRNHVELLRSVLNCLGFADYGKPMRILELGSGRGSFIAMAQQEPLCKTWHFEGVDMDMASLLINLKFNEELGNRKYKLICCYGEKLPFDDNRFDIIASFAALEHVGKLARQIAFVRESCRCLLPGGIGVFLFPNRFDVLQPEGHVYLRFLGFVPQRWKDRVSYILRGVPSGDIYPPDPITLMHALRKLHGVNFELHSWSEFSTKGLKKRIARSCIYKMFGPWNVLVARKPSLTG